MANIRNLNEYRKFKESLENKKNTATKSFRLNGLNLLLSSFTLTTVFSLLIVQLAPSNPSQEANKAIPANSDRTENTKLSSAESDFKKQQLDDINTTTNTMMMFDY